MVLFRFSMALSKHSALKALKPHGCFAAVHSLLLDCLNECAPQIAIIPDPISGLLSRFRCNLKVDGIDAATI